LAQVHGGVIDALASGVSPEVEGIARTAAFEAVEGVLLEVGGEAAARAGRRAMQGARAALLRTVAGARLEAEQLQYG